MNNLDKIFNKAKKKKTKHIRPNSILLILMFILSVFNLSATDSDFTDKPSSQDKRVASEEFRRGVQAYYRGSFNEAILLFEKALSYIPGEPLILDWLGKAYYSSGIEGAAIAQWEFAQKSGYGGMLLKNKIEVLKENRSLKLAATENIKFVEDTQISYKNGSTELFRQPLSACPVSDGSFWMTAYGSNEVLHFDINGLIIKRTKGPIEGFDRPFDIIKMKNGNLLVSEFASDRISILDKNGKFIKYFGKSGIKNGELMGPQFLCADNYDNIYVCDFGNARIAVFSPNGEPLFTFGEKSDLFGGFIAPAGIAFMDGLIFVADALKGAIYSFDTAGNYVQELLPENSLKGIESLRVWNGNLVAASQKKAYLIDAAFSTITEIASLGNTPAKVTAVTNDANGNLILIDHKNQTIEITTRINELAGGLFVIIKRVFSDKFPQITMEVSVKNRNGDAIVGLKENNFIVTEEHRIVADYQLAGAAYLNQNCDIAIVLERSPQSAKEKTQIESAIMEISKAMQGRGKITLISAGQIPTLEGKFSPESLIVKPNRFKASTAGDWKLDLAMRLATGELINSSQKRAIIFLSCSKTQGENFKQYSLNDIAAYMNNNNIRFYAVNLKQGKPIDEVSYLAKKTNGTVKYVYAETGLKAIIEDLIQKPIGIYQLKYKSSLPTNFGRKFLPVEVEVRLLQRSGRDEIGYFPPLE